MSLYIVLEVLAIAKQQEKNARIGKGEMKLLLFPHNTITTWLCVYKTPKNLQPDLGIFSKVIRYKVNL